MYVILELTLEVPNASDLPEAKSKPRPHSLTYERPKIMFLFCRLFIKGQSETCFFLHTITCTEDTIQNTLIF